MRWAFWRKPSGDEQEEPSRPLPSDTGLQVGRSGPQAAPRRRPEDEDDPSASGGPAIPTGSRPSPSTSVPDLPGGPVPDLAAGPLDRAHLPATRDAVVELVRAVLAGGTATPAAARPGTLDPETAAAVATAVLAARLPLLSGVTGSAHDDPDALRLQLAYADLLAGRAERLRRTAAPQITPEALRLAAREAAGGPATAGDAGAGDRALAAAVLLAQTSLDGGGPVEALPAEVDAAFAGGGR